MRSDKTFLGSDVCHWRELYHRKKCQSNRNCSCTRELIISSNPIAPSRYASSTLFNCLCCVLISRDILSACICCWCQTASLGIQRGYRTISFDIIKKWYSPADDAEYRRVQMHAKQTIELFQCLNSVLRIHLIADVPGNSVRFYYNELLFLPFIGR